MTDSPKNRAVDRALDIIEAFLSSNSDLTLVEISEKTGLAIATAHRSIQTMIRRGYVVRNPLGGKYRLGMQFVRIGGWVAKQNDIVQHATPLLQELSKKTGQNVNLSTYDNGEALCLINIESLQNFTFGIPVGHRLPIYTGALSKVILAHFQNNDLDSILPTELRAYSPNTIVKRETLIHELEEIREKGYALSNGELAIGATAIAAPIYNYMDNVIAGISVSGPDHMFNQENTQMYLTFLLNTAEMISDSLGYKKNTQT